MADVNAPSGQAPAMAPPVRTDDQILPRIRWVPNGKSNCYLDLEKSQGNPIYKIAVDLLNNTNFFKAFTASSTIPSIYIQQFWDTVQYDKKAGNYRCQLDEQWFVLTKDTLREALQITPINNNQQFVAPLSSDMLINFVNKLGYPKLVRNVFNVVTNDMFQPWRALLTIINLCLTGKTSRKHKFHPRPNSPLHLPNEDPVLSYLKFSAKGTKREVFGMPIPGSLITADIRSASYYQEYLASVAKYKRYLAGETASVQDSPAPKPTKPARKPKSTTPKAPPRPSVLIPVTSAQPAPTSAPAKPQEKKHKQATETSDKPPKAKKSKYGLVRKKSTLKYVATSKAEDVSIKEPQVAAEDAKLQKVLEESMKTAYAAMPRGPLPPVVIREPEYGKYQPLLEVPGKGKAKVTEDQVAHDLLIRQRGGIRKGSDPGAQDEGQARSNPDETSKRQAGPDPVMLELRHNLFQVLWFTLDQTVLLEEPAISSGTLSSLQHLSKDINFGDLFFSYKPSDDDKNAETKVESMVNVPIQQALSSISLMTSPIIDLTSRPESPKVHQQFKATTNDTTTTTTTTLSPPQAQQQSTAEAMMIKRIGELEHIIANLIQVNKDMEERLDKLGARLYTLEQLDIPQQVSKAVSEVVTDAIDWAMQAPLRNCFRDLPEADIKEIIHQRMWETESYKTHEDNTQLFEALEKSMNRDHAEELAASGSSQVPPPPPPPSSTNQESPSKGSATPSSSQTATSAEYHAWTMTDVRLRLSISLTPTDLEMDEDMGPNEQAQLSDDEDIRSAHIPKVNLTQDWWKPLEEERPATPELAWSIPSSDVPLKPQDLEGPAFEIIKVFHPDVIHLQYQMEECHKLLTDSVDDPILRTNVSKPLPLGGPPGQVTIQSDFFFNKDLEYLRYGSKGSRPALSISKMKEAYYPDDGLEKMVPYQFWIDEECKYNIAAMMNPGLNTRFWTRKDVDWCKAFMFAIQRHLRTRRIFRNLESFVGGRVRDGDYRLLKRTK
nr:histone deacetylase 14 [Tanacetum cinerariifolium]